MYTFNIDVDLINLSLNTIIVSYSNKTKYALTNDDQSRV